jgi:hypothetical protein
MPDRGAIEELRAAFGSALAAASTEAALKSLNDAFLGRKSGRLTEQMKTVASSAAC